MLGLQTPESIISHYTNKKHFGEITGFHNVRLNEDIFKVHNIH